MITDLEYHAHDHEHESFGDLTKKETPGKLSAAAATALKKDKEKVEHAASRGAAAPSRHRRASSPGMMEVAGFFFDFEAVRTDLTEMLRAGRARPGQGRLQLH
jgi:hypothetical protein